MTMALSGGMRPLPGVSSRLWTKPLARDSSPAVDDEGDTTGADEVGDGAAAVLTAVRPEGAAETALSAMTCGDCCRCLYSDPASPSLLRNTALRKIDTG